MTGVLPTAASQGLLNCRACGWLLHDPNQSSPVRCARCGAVITARKPDSLQRASALLLAAAVFYVPANVLPILRTTSLGTTRDDTIVSGVLGLWSTGSWPLALLVFVASILVPCLKFLILGFLVWSTHRGWRWGLHDRSVLYRLIEYVGRWSMLDIFVVTLMVTLVQLRGIAIIHAGAGAPAFAAVVVLTMYAAQAFDPRLMWDRGCR